jgi:hypothetical protein
LFHATGSISDREPSLPEKSKTGFLLWIPDLNSKKQAEGLKNNEGRNSLFPHRSWLFLD